MGIDKLENSNGRVYTQFDNEVKSSDLHSEIFWSMNDTEGKTFKEIAAFARENVKTDD